jgi:glycosidase
MQWNSSVGAGFTSGKPWLKLHPNYESVNVESDLADEDGVIAFFKKLNAYRKSSKILILGSYKELYAGRSVYAFEREYEGERLVTICNFSKKPKPVPKGIFGSTVLSNYKDESKKLRPYEFRLIKIN